jgi:hypothetical protein
MAEHTREVDSSSIDKVSSGSKHSNTRVLKLGSTEPRKSLVVSKLRKTKWIKVLKRGSRSTNVFKGIKSSGCLNGMGKMIDIESVRCEKKIYSILLNALD